MSETTDAEPPIERPVEAQRLDAFVDAAFAFAVSLLIIAGAEPLIDVDSLLRALGRAPAFAASFMLVIVFWLGHREYGRYVPRRDPASVMLSLAIVFTVLIYVFPLRVMTESGLAYFSGGALPGGDLIQSPGDLVLLYSVYGLGFALLGLLFWLLFTSALRRGERLGLLPPHRDEMRSWQTVWGVLVVAGLLSALLAQLLPMERFAPIPGFAYWLIPIGIFGANALRRRRPRAAAA